MLVFKEKDQLKPYINSLKLNGKTVGFVPTMGALHDGHISLVKVSKEKNDITVVSIFVNPTQFNNPEDLKKYPRTEDKDLKLLEENGVDIVYLPSVEDLYNTNEGSRKYNFGGLENVMEGTFRPGHFDGVATVVSKLFRIVEPTDAFFGEKDFQQVRIVQEMVKQEKIDVIINPVPIKRAYSGLALSSRNMRLDNQQLLDAPFIYKTLLEAKILKEKGNNPVTIKLYVEEQFKNSPFELEYFEIADEENLLTVEEFNKNTARAFVVAYAGDVRLIDNLQF